MSQSKWYRGRSDVVTCQSGDGLSHLCAKHVRSTGIGLVRGRASHLYECEAGHRFALTDAPNQRPVDPAARRGALDSGESGTHRSGESQNSPVRQSVDAAGHGYTDSRRVTLIPSTRPEFGRRQ